MKLTAPYKGEVNGNLVNLLCLHPNSSIKKLQTMPNSQEKGLVRGLKVFVGVAFKLFDGT